MTNREKENDENFARRLIEDLEEQQLEHSKNRKTHLIENIATEVEGSQNGSLLEITSLDPAMKRENLTSGYYNKELSNKYSHEIVITRNKFPPYEGEKRIPYSAIRDIEIWN